MLTASNVAQQLGISARKVYDLAADGSLPGLRFGRALRFEPAAVQEYIESCRSIESKTQRVNLAMSLSSAVVSKGGESELESSFRRLGIAPKLTRSTGKSRPGSTPKPPASNAPRTRSAKLSLVTSTNESQS